MKTHLKAECSTQKAEGQPLSAGARLVTSRSRASERSAFTMIEIAISLAVIGFALVAIIGILPTGMGVQRENRQETIMNQDATIFIEALRSGARRMDDLTNYVTAIKNYVTEYNSLTQVVNNYTYLFTRTNSTRINTPNGTTEFPLTNAYYIVGLLSTPKIIPLAGTNTGFYSNYVVASVYSLSGLASEKPPQTNDLVQELGLSYRIIAAVNPYTTNYYDPLWTNYLDPSLYAGGVTNAAEIDRRKTRYAIAKNLEANLHDVRLTFRWPILPNGELGPGRQVFRTMVTGPLVNDPPGYPFFFFQPRTYVKGS